METHYIRTKENNGTYTIQYLCKESAMWKDLAKFYGENAKDNKNVLLDHLLDTGKYQQS